MKIGINMEILMKRYKMKRVMFVILFLFIICLGGCFKFKNSQERHQEIYNEEGFAAYVEYVKKTKDYEPIIVSDEGLTPLLFAMKENDAESACLFLEYGASVYEEDRNEKDFWDYFIQISDISAKNQIANETINLQWIASSGKEKYLAVFEFILDNDIEYEVVNNLVEKNIIHPDYEEEFAGRTVLMFAAQRNTDVRIIDCLLTHTEQINKTNDNKWTAAMYAARYNPNPQIFEQFVLKGANLEPNEFGITLTMLAACNPNPGVLLKVPNAPSQINFQTANGKTALMYACENGQDLSSISLLVEGLGANVNLVDKDGKTALMYALASYSGMDVIEYLINAGAFVDVVDLHGNGLNYYLKSNNMLKDINLISENRE